MNLAKKPEAAEEAVSADNEEAVCCFCGQSLWLADSVSLLIQRRIGDEERQHLFAHPACLRAQVVRDIPLLTELID